MSEPIACRECGLTFVSTHPSQVMCTKAECKNQARRAAQKRHRLAHPTYDAEKQRRWKERNPGYVYEWPAKRENGLRVHEYKSATPCADCQTIYPAECMDFDHTGDDKLNNVGTMVAHGWSWEKISTEIAKCDLVCSNCHRIRTRLRRLGNDNGT